MNKQNQFFDVAKGISSIMVIITHYAWSDKSRMIQLFPYWISMAVPIFMIISGYVSALSYKRKDIQYFFQLYEPAGLLKKYIRYSIPFFMFFGTQIILEYFLYNNVTIERVKEYFFKGGFGKHGTYYYPILLQMILLFPIIYWLIKKFEFGLLYCFGLNIAFEVIQNLIEMKGKDYRLLVFRYIYVIAFGSYLALRGQKKIKKWYPMLFVSGILYITLVNYTSYEAKLFVYWTSTSAIAIMYIIPIFSFFMGWYNKKSEILEKNTIIKVFTLIGKASYNIFFVQILYYNYFDEVIREFCLNDTVHILVNIVICLIFGVIFYHLEMPITKRIIRKIDSLLYFL